MIDCLFGAPGHFKGGGELGGESFLWKKGEENMDGEDERGEQESSSE